MKRDFDLIRDIMLRIEASDKESFFTDDFLDLTDDERKLCYNIHLMYEAGLIEASEISIPGNLMPEYRIYWLSNTGCDFLGDIRNQSIWLKTKSTLENFGSSVALDMVSYIAKTLIKAGLAAHLQF